MISSAQIGERTQRLASAVRNHQDGTITSASIPRREMRKFKNNQGFTSRFCNAARAERLG